MSQSFEAEFVVKNPARSEDLQFTFSLDNTILDLKNKIYENWNVEPSEQRIIHRGVQLVENDSKLRDVFKIENPTQNEKYVIHCVSKTPLTTPSPTTNSLLPPLLLENPQSPNTTPIKSVSPKVKSSPSPKLGSSSSSSSLQFSSPITKASSPIPKIPTTSTPISTSSNKVLPNSPIINTTNTTTATTSSSSTSNATQTKSLFDQIPQQQSSSSSSTTTTSSYPLPNFTPLMFPNLTQPAQFPVFPNIPLDAFGLNGFQNLNTNPNIPEDIRSQAYQLLQFQSLIASAAAAASATSQIQTLQALMGAGFFKQSQNTTDFNIPQTSTLSATTSTPIQVSPTSSLGQLPPNILNSQRNKYFPNGQSEHQQALQNFQSQGQHQQENNNNNNNLNLNLNNNVNLANNNNNNNQGERHVRNQREQPHRFRNLLMGEGRALLKLALLVFILTQGESQDQIIMYSIVAFVLYLIFTGKLDFLKRFIPVASLSQLFQTFQQPNSLQRQVEEAVQENALPQGQRVQEHSLIWRASRHALISVLAFVLTLNPGWDPLIAQQQRDD